MVCFCPPLPNVISDEDAVGTDHEFIASCAALLPAAADDEMLSAHAGTQIAYP
jgi:hypothetical protein